MASLTKQGDYYKITFTDKSRNPKQKSIYRPRDLGRKHARKIRIELERLFSEGDYDPWKDDYKEILRGKKTDKKVKDAVEEYLSYKTKNDWSSNTAQNCKYLFNDFLDQQGIGYNWIDEIHEQNFNDFINREADISSKTRSYYKRNFKPFIKFLNTKGYNELDESKLKVYQSNKGYKEGKKYFEPSEIKKLCSKIEEKVKSDIEKGRQNKKRNSLWLIDFIWWQVMSGMRLNETLSIRVKDVDLDSGYVRIYNKKAKRKERFKILENKKLMSIAKKYVKKASSGEELLFRHKDGKRVSRTFKKYLKGALPEKEDYNQHCLRHTCCVWLIREDMNLAKVKEYMRHSNISTTMEYAQLVEDDYMGQASEVFNKVVQ